MIELLKIKVSFASMRALSAKTFEIFTSFNSTKAEANSGEERRTPSGAAMLAVTWFGLNPSPSTEMSSHFPVHSLLKSMRLSCERVKQLLSSTLLLLKAALTLFHLRVEVVQSVSPRNI